LSIRHSKYQKYTPTDCFFGDFAHWEYLNAINIRGYTSMDM